MTPEQLAALREPFAPEQVGKLPRITCSKCSKAQGRVCDQHRKERCDDCGNYISTQHMHLDYVGHAAVTHRLLMVDPGWTWEPVAFDDNGAPLIRYGNNEAELWIRLTVCGVTRVGVGTAPASSFELAKQLIGDAIRNAAMRFGVALDLWAKDGSLHDDTPPQNPSNRREIGTLLLNLLAELGRPDPAQDARSLWDSLVPEDCDWIDDDLWARLEAAARDLGDAA